MPRSLLRAALAGLLTLGPAAAGVLVPASGAAAAAPDGDPLQVHIDSISPELPRRGDVEISGTVTNVSDETFTRINLHTFSSQTPILNAPTLAVSATSDPALAVGERVTEPGTFDTVDELAPGQTARFSDSVPVELLGTSGQPGVYWIGIHALGDSEEVPRDEVADGRARTFIPMRPTGRETQEAAVMLSVRSPVWFERDGRVAGTERWARRLAEGGSLDGALDMAASAGSTPYDLLVDPAVLLAVTKLAQGNPPRTLAPDPTVPGQEPSPSEEPQEEESGSTTLTPETLGTLSPTAESAPDEADEAASALATAAFAWLDRLRTLVGAREVLTLPYGDLDVSAAVRHDPQRLEQAIARSAEVMAGLGLGARPTVAPLDGRLSPEALAAVPAGTLVLLGDTAFDIPPRTDSSVVSLLGHEVVVTSTGAQAGGPGPTAATDPLALRQRVLSEAALRLVDGQEAPLVVTLPTVWRGSDALSFFAGLQQDWLDVVPVGEVAAGVAEEVPDTSLAYTDSDVTAELDAASFTTATRATDSSTLLEQVLSLVTTVEVQVRDEVLVTLSEHHRSRPRLARRSADRIDDALRADLGSVTVEAPARVTLSSDSGRLGATLVNGLDEPVRVELLASTDGDLTLSGDAVRELGPRARTVVRFKATADRGGVHQVRFTVASADGVPLGAADELTIRAARVSALIWVAMGGGALVLFGMIGYRLPGQIRARRAERAADAAGDPPPEDAPHDSPHGEQANRGEQADRTLGTPAPGHP